MLDVPLDPPPPDPEISERLASRWHLRDRPIIGFAARFAAASSLEGGIFSARSDRYKLVWAPRQGTWGQGEALGRGYDPVAFFDLDRDPAEQVNLAGAGSLEEAWLRAHLRAWIEAGWPQDDATDEPAVDDETKARLRALGYAE